VKFFPNIMNYRFTAHMEKELDDISEGKLQWHPMLESFYRPFEGQLHTAQQHMPQVVQEEPVGRDCPSCGGVKTLVIRYGRFGKFIGCANYPTCRYTEPLLERTGIPCPECGQGHGGEIVVRKSRRGRIFYGCTRYPECQFTSWKRPLPQPCPNCGSLLVEQNKSTAQCIKCASTYPMDELAEISAEPA
jgi:DNA topoisomerase-1